MESVANQRRAVAGITEGGDGKAEGRRQQAEVKATAKAAALPVILSRRSAAKDLKNGRIVKRQVDAVLAHDEGDFGFCV